MSASPIDTFEALLRACISEVRVSRRARDAIAGAGLIISGVLCSLATSYLLASLGLAV